MPFNHKLVPQDAAAARPLGELSTNLLNCPVDSASSMQQARTEGKIGNATSVNAPQSHRVKGSTAKVIDNLMYDVSHVDESVAVRLSSTGSSGSTNWLGKHFFVDNHERIVLGRVERGGELEELEIVDVNERMHCQWGQNMGPNHEYRWWNTSLWV